MAQTIDEVPVSDLPLAPINPLPYRQKVRAIRAFHTGVETLRDAGGPVTRLRLGPTWLMPPVVVATSPQSARDILSRSGEHADITRVHHETRHLFGPSLFDLTHKPWLSRRRTLQPIFTKQHVRNFGGHMAQAAQTIVDNWGDDTQIDLDTECRKLTLRALGRSVLGLDLAEHTNSLAKPVRNALEYVADRAVQPLRAPRWLPTLARYRARSTRDELHRLAGQILQSCRSDPSRDAPLVQALIAARDPATGQALSDDEIRTELVSFIVAGHETTATTLAYALWALGRHPEMQDRVRTEVTGIGDCELTPDDATSLRYTIQVLREALRLCPAAATTARTATRDIEVGGYRVEAGTMLVVGIYALHRDPTLWDNPLNFDPERFGPQNSTGRNRWQYLPFGAGPRSCIGDNFAMLEATLALATIIRTINIQSADPEFPMLVPFTTIAAAPIRARANVISRGLRQ